MKHTKGPWRALIDNKRHELPMCMVATGAGKAIDATDSGDTWEESGANAKLIAAAPDLLEACVIASKYLNSLKGSIHRHSNAFRLVEAAIAKAEPK